MRTYVKRAPVVTAVLDYLQANVTAFPIQDGLRPSEDSANPDRDNLHTEAPYALVFLRPGGTFDGPLNDTQVDVIFPIQITAVGRTQTEALIAQDLIGVHMQPVNIDLSAEGRKVRDIRKVVASDGALRDDDVPTPVFYSYEIYEIDTVPV